MHEMPLIFSPEDLLVMSELRRVIADRENQAGVLRLDFGHQIRAVRAVRVERVRHDGNRNARSLLGEFPEPVKGEVVNPGILFEDDRNLGRLLRHCRNDQTQQHDHAEN